MSGSVMSGSAAQDEWAATARLVAERSAVLRATRRVLAVLVRCRWWLLPGLAAALGWRDRAVFVPDYALFARSGERLLHGDLAAVYADPQVQAGPWELLLFAPLAALDRWLPGWGQPGPEVGLGVLGAGHTLLAVAGPALLVAAAMAGTRALSRLAVLPAAEQRHPHRHPRLDLDLDPAPTLPAGDHRLRRVLPRQTGQNSPQTVITGEGAGASEEAGAGAKAGAVAGAGAEPRGGGRSGADRGGGAGLEAAVGALVLLWGTATQLVQTGHPAQGAVPVCWLVAGLAARRGRPLAAGALLALAAGWETWGVLAVPVVLLAPRLRQAFAAGAVAVLGTALTYLPFLASGGFGMARFRWPVLPGTLVARLGADPATGFGWDWRLAQGAAALAACTVVALLARRSLHGIWLAPAAAVCARLVLDPTLYDYYWVPVLLLALAGLVLTVTAPVGAPGTRARSLAVTAAVTLCWWTATGWGRSWPGTLAVTLPALLLAAGFVHSRAGRPARPVGGDG